MLSFIQLDLECSKKVLFKTIVDPCFYLLEEFQFDVFGSSFEETVQRFASLTLPLDTRLTAQDQFQKTRSNSIKNVL